MLTLTDRLLLLTQLWPSWEEIPEIDDDEAGDEGSFHDTAMHYGAAKSVCEHLWMAQWRFQRADAFTRFYTVSFMILKMIEFALKIMDFILKMIAFIDCDPTDVGARAGSDLHLK